MRLQYLPHELATMKGIVKRKDKKENNNIITTTTIITIIIIIIVIIDGLQNIFPSFLCHIGKHSK